MAAPMTMTSSQKIPVGVTILDEGGEAFATVPEGYTVSFESSNPSVVGVSVRPDGLNADLSSDDIGTSTVTVTVIKPDGSHLNGSPDVTDITVVNAAPNSANVTFGAPEEE
jgi:hypothetical protein